MNSISYHDFLKTKRTVTDRNEMQQVADRDFGTDVTPEVVALHIYWGGVNCIFEQVGTAGQPEYSMTMYNSGRESGDITELEREIYAELIAE